MTELQDFLKAASYAPGSYISTQLADGAKTVKGLDDSAFANMTKSRVQRQDRITTAIKNTVEKAEDTEPSDVLAYKARMMLNAGQQYRKDINQIEYIEGMKKAFNTLFVLLAPFREIDIGKIVIQRCQTMLSDYDRALQIREVSKGGYEGAKQVAMQARIARSKENQQMMADKYKTRLLFAE